MRASRSSAALSGAPPPPPPKPHRSSAALAALFFALLLLVSIKIHFEHLRIAPSARTSASQWRSRLGGLPRGILEPTSDLEMKPLWGDAGVKDNRVNYTALLAMAVGISQKKNVDLIVRKFLMGNFSVILLHYDGNVDGWNDLRWSNKAIHISAPNQTKWWFAKRFLHPDVVSMYEYIFLWDEDLGVEHFHPVRYLQIMSSERLDISQPALDPNRSSEIHHRITVRNPKTKVHRRVFDSRGSLNCSDESRGPPCTGWIEGMAPVFSRAAWRCAWHLIQNDLIHGWGLDMKLGYCAQVSSRSLDLRTRVRRQSTAELSKFKERWNRAVKEDSEWIDPYENFPKRKGRG